MTIIVRDTNAMDFNIGLPRGLSTSDGPASWETSGFVVVAVLLDLHDAGIDVRRTLRDALAVGVRQARDFDLRRVALALTRILAVLERRPGGVAFLVAARTVDVLEVLGLVLEDARPQVGVA